MARKPRAHTPHGARPLANWVVRLLAKQNFAGDPILDRLRGFGAKVVYRDTATTTHLVTFLDPPVWGESRPEGMRPSDFAEFVTAYGDQLRRGRTPRCYSYRDLTRAIDQATAEMLAAGEAARLARTAPAKRRQMPGFVGF